MKVLEFLNETFNKEGLLYFEIESENIIGAYFKSNNKHFVDFYIDKIKEIMSPKLKKGDYVEISGILFRCYNEEKSLCTTVKELSEEVIKNIIDGKRLSKENKVRYNNDVTDDSWENSVIRRILNNKFKEKYLNNIEIDGEVRLLTKEEVEKMDSEFHSVSDWYWTMTSNTDENDFYAYVFVVGGSSNPGRLDYYWVDYTYVVRPVVSLKSDVLLTGDGSKDNPYLIN